MSKYKKCIIRSWETPLTHEFNNEFIGIKASGLLLLPKEWTPPFIVLTKSFYKLWNDNKETKNILTLLTKSEQKMLRDFFKNISSYGRNIFIRSNSPDEDIWARGEHDSYAVENNFESIGEAIQLLLKNCNGSEMNIILQPCIEPGVQGHMSNERRISKSEKIFMIESMDNKPTLIRATNFQKDLKELRCKNKKELLGALRYVAFLLLKNTKIKCTWHIEWIWTGKRLWIVQADKIFPELLEDTANKLILKDRTKILEKSTFRIIKHFSKINSDKWKKLRSPIQFKKNNIPVSNVYLLTGEEWNNKEMFENIKLDMEKISNINPVVIRCDISKSAPIEEFYLPTSGALKYFGDIKDFMNSINETFNKKRIAPKDWTFLISNLIETNSSALIHAFPNAQRIRVDALWGYPDGLSYYPHDSYFYYPQTKKIKKKTNYKNVGLFPNEIDGKWSPYEIQDPFDWKAVLSEKKVSILAEWGLKLANSLNKEIQLMAFTGVNDENRYFGCLPWHYTDIPVPLFEYSIDHLPKDKSIKVISNEQDLVKIKSLEQNERITGIHIMPDTDKIRDNEFLTEVGQLAESNLLPLYFKGSLLGHAYYIMKKTGANVIPIAQTEPIEKSVTYNKLVRDNIPLIVKSAGGLARVRNLNSTEASYILTQKIIEEGLEIFNSKDEREMTNEIADILEVIDALIKSSRLDRQKINNIRRRKKKERGGFENLILLEETSIKSLKNINQKQGILPLTLGLGKVSKDKHKNIDFKLKSQSEFEFDFELEFPFIPQNKPMQYKLKNDNTSIEVTIKYQERNIHLALRKKSFPEGLDYNNNQLSLFNNEE